jgi:hypothetical protein
MRTLLRLLRTDQVGSTLSAEMALVTSVTVGALFMGMAEFSATVNREFQNSAAQTGLLTVDDAVGKKEASDEQKKKDAEEKKKKSGWRFKRAEDRQETPESSVNPSTGA